MAAATAGVEKNYASVADRVGDRGVVRSYLDRNWKSRLQQGHCRDICTGQLIHDAIAIGIHPRAEPLFRLDSVVRVERIVRELPQRNKIPRLRKRPNNQTGWNLPGSHQTGSGNSLNPTAAWNCRSKLKRSSQGLLRHRDRISSNHRRTITGLRGWTAPGRNRLSVTGFLLIRYSLRRSRRWIYPLQLCEIPREPAEAFHPDQAAGRRRAPM